jgi:excisionase family DNA binding protein
MTTGELEGIPVDELFEPITSLPEENDFDRPLPSTQGNEGQLQQGRTGSSEVATPRPATGSTLPRDESIERTSLADVRFLTVAEVALIMRVSKMAVYRLVHTGELEAIRVGRSYRVPEAAVNQYLRAAFLRYPEQNLSST